MNLNTKRRTYIRDLNTQGFTDGQIWVTIQHEFGVTWLTANNWIVRCKRIWGKHWNINALNATIQQVP